MRRTFGLLAAGLIVLGANVAGAQEKSNLGTVGPEPTGANIAVPSAGVGVNAAPGGGLGVTAPGVNVTVPPAGSGAGVGVNVPAAGIHANVNPNAWRYRWHNNRWWFFHPNNRWSYWNNNRWNAYREPSLAGANSYANRRFSNARRQESGYRGLPSNAAAGAGPSNPNQGNPRPSNANLNNLVPSNPSTGSTNQSPLERANPGDANVPPGP